MPFDNRLCYQHLKIHKRASVPREHAAGVSDDDYEPEEIYIKHDKLESSRYIAENIAECFETSPIVQLKRKKTCSLLHKFTEREAPGQEKDFMSKVLGINMTVNFE